MENRKLLSEIIMELKTVNSFLGFIRDAAAESSSIINMEELEYALHDIYTRNNRILKAMKELV